MYVHMLATWIKLSVLVMQTSFCFVSTANQFLQLPDTVTVPWSFFCVRYKCCRFHVCSFVRWSDWDEESMWCCSFKNYTGDWWTWQSNQCLQSEFSLYDGRLVHLQSVMSVAWCLLFTTVFITFSTAVLVDLIIMAAEGKAIIFYRCNLF